MKQIFVMCALLLGVCAANAQETDTVKYAAGNDLYRGITRKLPYRQMVTPYGVEVTFAKTVHIIFPSAVRYVDLGSNHIIAGKADGAENVIRVKATTEGFPGETNFSVICEDGSFYSFNAKYAREPEMLNIEMKDFLENEDTSDFSHTRMNIYFRELGNESPLLVKLIMQSIYKNNDRKVRHLGSKRFGIQFLIKGIYTYNGMLYVHTQTKNSSNVPFDTDFIKFKIVDKKVPKRTAIQETVLDAVRSYNEVIEIAGKSTVRTVYALPKFTIPDDKLLLVELYEKNGGRHQLPGMKGLQVTAGMVDGVHWNAGSDFAYHFGAAYSVYTKNANRWVIGGEYLHKKYDYKDMRIPVEQFTAEGGYYLKFLSDRRKTFFLSLGLSALAGYETSNLSTAVR